MPSVEGHMIMVNVEVRLSAVIVVENRYRERLERLRDIGSVMMYCMQNP